MNPATDRHEPQSTAQGANYGDSSNALFSMYLSRAEKFDKEQSESWKGNADGILVFVRPPQEYYCTPVYRWMTHSSDARPTHRRVFSPRR